MPYDPTTVLGQTRLLAGDFDDDNQYIGDSSYTALLSLCNQSVRLAAAEALDIMASNEVLIQKKIKNLDLQTDGPSEATALRARAQELRRQEYEGAGDLTGMFDWAEMVLTPASERERMIDQWLRQGGTV